MPALPELPLWLLLSVPLGSPLRATGVRMATTGAEGEHVMGTGLSQPRRRGHTREGGEGLEREDEATPRTTGLLCCPGAERDEDDSFPLLQNLLDRLW